jgi:hypothetical protein
MNQKPLLPFVISLALVACAEDPNSETGGSGGAGGASTSASDAASSGAGTTTSTGSGIPSGQTVTIEMDAFDVPPGAEVYKCQNFANPFGGEAEVSAFESHMTGGSHHLLMFYEDAAADGPLEDCSGLEFGPTPYSTQLPDDSVVFPAGVAAAIPSTKGIRLQSHYLNTTSETITAHVKMVYHLAAPGTVKDHAGVLFIVQPFIYVQPNSTKDVTYDCNLPQDMSIIKTASHMHKHGTKFASTVAGAPFYETDSWDHPVPALFDPPRKLSAGDPLHFSCTFVNNSPNALTFGESAETNEMCILVASFFPAPDGDPTISCNK